MEIAIYIGLTTALVELLKSLDVIANRWLPVVSLIIGGVFGYLAGLDLITMLTIGLSASGFYSAQKTVRGN